MVKIHTEMSFLLVTLESFKSLNSLDEDSRTLLIKQTSHNKYENVYLGH